MSDQNPPHVDETFDFQSFCGNVVIRESAPAKIALMRGPVYHDDPAWEPMIRHRREMTRFFAEVGVRLMVDTTDGFAYLDQAGEGDAGGDWPKLLYRDRFSYDMTCVLVILREWMLTQETKAREDRAPLRLDELVNQLRPFSRKKDANVEKEDKRWRETINKVATLGFLKRWKGEEAFIVQPIVRARLSIDHLKSLRDTLAAHNASKESTVEEAT